MHTATTLTGSGGSKRAAANAAALLAVFFLGGAGGYMAKSVPQIVAGQNASQAARAGLQAAVGTNSSIGVSDAGNQCLWINHHKGC